MVGIGGARSDANEANDMQKLVFVYLSRRASHLCKPGMTAGGAGMKKSPFGERAGWISAVRRLQFSEVLEHLLVPVGTGLF